MNVAIIGGLGVFTLLSLISTILVSKILVEFHLIFFVLFSQNK